MSDDDELPGFSGSPEVPGDVEEAMPPIASGMLLTPEYVNGLVHRINHLLERVAELERRAP